MYSIMSKDAEFTPALFMAFVEICYYPNCGFKPTEKMISRVGAAKTLKGAEELIANDKRAMGETYGGLIEPVRLKQRTYSIWNTAGWEKVA